MKRVRFDRLYTVRLESESQNGRTEVCREPDGTRWVKLCIRAPDCQREILNALDERVPVRLERGVLEVLIPWQEGISLQEWLYERTPTPGQRRDACLSLLARQMDAPLPDCLIALSARPENLVVTGNGSAALQCLPDLRAWEPGLGEAQAVCAVSAVINKVLTPEPGKLTGISEELQLMRRRQMERDYTSWSQLQRDVSAVPDKPPHINRLWLSGMRRMQGRVFRWSKYILRLLAALLLAAALLSLILTYRQRRNETGPVWQGMPQVGGQDLRNEEGR